MNNELRETIRRAVPPMTDKQIRETVKDMPNGGYAVEICVGCSMYWTEPDGDVEKAKVVKECRRCRK